jgi:hypothetical protein
MQMFVSIFKLGGSVDFAFSFFSQNVQMYGCVKLFSRTTEKAGGVVSY